MFKNQLTIIALLSASFYFTACDKDYATFSAKTDGMGGSTARFTISGNWLYTVDSKMLTTYNIADPANPSLVNTQQVGFEIETIFPFADKLFIGSTSLIHIFSLADPAKPSKLSTAISPEVMRRCDPVVARDTVAFATLRTTARCGGTQSLLAVYDIRDITKPVHRATYPLSSPLGLGYSGNTLYVCDAPGLLVFDISNPFNPQLKKTIPVNNIFDIIPYNSLLLTQTSSGGAIYDISVPASPVKLSDLN